MKRSVPFNQSAGSVYIIAGQRLMKRRAAFAKTLGSDRSKGGQHLNERKAPVEDYK